MSKERPGAGETPRKHERFRIKVPVYIAEEDGTFLKMISLESRDVSAGGLSFETSRPIQLHARSKVVVSKLGDLSQSVLIHARVAHIERDPVTGRHTVGLEFVEFANITREEVMARIDAWAREAAGAAAKPLPDADPGRSPVS
jgi:c-di-GMP-binding flagellar brake protein YcgR